MSIIVNVTDLEDLDETPQLVSAGPITVHWISLVNPNAEVDYVTLWDADDEGDVTPGTTPHRLRLPVGPSFCGSLPVAIKFEVGCVANFASTVDSTTAPSAEAPLVVFSR